MNVLVVGGAGFVGSCMARMLHAAGHAVTVLDDLSTGRADAVRWGRLAEGSILDAPFLDGVMAAQRFDAVMHFAARSLAGESVDEPERYYATNAGGTATLAAAMRRHGVRRLVFSSTAAVYGEPVSPEIAEDHPKQPVNPYGWSKLFAERVLADCGEAWGLRSVCLRYFNACGADPSGEAGESRAHETHLVPLALQVASGRLDALEVHGTDYPTPDGTCLRDYVHVHDICAAHLLAMERLARGGGSARYNLGTGRGHSVREVIAAVRRVTGHAIPTSEGPRRPGDPARLVADGSLARRELGWAPRYPGLDDMIAHAWAWEHAQGGTEGAQAGARSVEVAR